MPDAHRYEVTVSIGSAGELSDAEAEKLCSNIEVAAKDALGEGAQVSASVEGRRAIRLVLETAKELSSADQIELAGTVQNSVVDVLEAGDGVQVGRFIPGSGPSGAVHHP